MGIAKLGIKDLKCASFGSLEIEFDMQAFKEFQQESEVFDIPHRHDCYVLFLATSGGGSHLIDFKKYEIESGMLFLMHPGMIHEWKEMEDLDGYLMLFTADFFSQRYNNNILLNFPFFSISNENPVISLNPEEFKKIRQISRWMLEEYLSNKLDSAQMLRSYLNIILTKAGRLFDLKKDHNSQDGHHHRLVLAQFEQLIDKHYKKKHLVRDYASLLHLTPNYLNVICKSQTEKSAGDLIRSRIILEAKRMLLHEDMSVSEISTELNFEDNAYFSRFFKKYTGSSPIKFKKEVFHLTK
ncbi:MAG: AraC family transcriptional regulator [Bacteroidia bacterium]|nr:AraC family transcriptional regulator [Bacteroidia bacterium]